MGAQASQLEKQIGPENFPPNEHYFGLVNFGNTCYCNSVLQALYHCRAFREKVLAHRSRSPKTENLLTTLSDLFHCIYTQKRRVGTLAPKKFIQRLRKDNELFDNYTQQDAHEFLNYLLNTIADILQAEKTNPPPPTKSKKGGGGGLLNGSGPSKASTAASNKNSSDTPASENNQKSEHSTWVHEIFEGTLTNETRCLNCETTSSKDENFIDLSVDIEPNTSISQCLRGFSMLETLSRECKYYCEVCCSKQEAQKRMLVKKLPNLLALHLKRFKYQEQYNRHTKLSYRVVFPMELRLPNLSEDAINPNRMYTLSAIVVHCGIGPNRGHYICIVKSGGYWLVFDDDIVDKIDPSSFENFYGLSTEFQKNNMESGYILFYESIE